MPLPPALAARLAKRGLLKESSEKPVEAVSAIDGEEIIAEDYDDETRQISLPGALHNAYKQVDDEPFDQTLVYETPACPNRSNAYHECVAFCKQRWGMKTFQHDPSLDKKHDRLIHKYPLPAGYVEVGDPDTGRFYYWNTETDEVTWLPPQHPRAKLGLSAERLKELMQKSESSRTTGGQYKDKMDSEGEESDEGSTDLDDEEEEELDEERDFEQLEKEVLRRKRQSEEDRGIVKKKKSLKIDPMDPAAYSDIPKGGWSSGLEGRGAAKTGADVTAAGPLFQQRPYPNPGAVLRMNDKKKVV